MVRQFVEDMRYTRRLSSSMTRMPAVALLLIIAGCTTAPETGRSQLLLISGAEETRIGIKQFQQIKANTPINHDQRLNATLQRVGSRIAAVAPLPDARWEFVLFDDPEKANAFCLPGGKVGVYTGILKYARDETGLATIIGHEVGHAVAHHGSEQVSYSLLSRLGAQVVGQIAGAYVPGSQQAIMSVYDVGSQYGVLLPYSRAHELEADHLGLLYMARAGYDPRQALGFWRRFSQAAEGSKPAFEFISTHPLDANRIRRLQEWMPTAMAENRPAGVRRR